MTVLVTGARGDVGAAVLAGLLAAGERCGAEGGRGARVSPETAPHRRTLLNSWRRRCGGYAARAVS
jgi:uncharacterized protein YbjT (DUF2867 family)